MSIVQLRDARAAQSTCDAIRYVLYQHGMAYQNPDWLLSSLARCSQKQIRELLAWVDARNNNHARDLSGHQISPSTRKLVARFLR